MINDPYSVLEVGSEATEIEIKAAYRRLAATYHPDRNPGFQDAANEKLKELNAAYEAIKAASQSRGEGTANAADDGSKTEQGPGETGADDEPTRRQSASSAPGAESHREARRAGPNHRSMIVAELARFGLLEEDSDREDPTVDVLTSLIPRSALIALCVGYTTFSTSDQYGFREMHRSAMRIAGVAGFSSLPSISAGAGPLERGEVILCTVDSLFWTVRRVAPADSSWVRVSVTAFALDLVDVLGSKVANRRKGEVQVWIDEGPTLTFCTGRSDAEALSAYVDATAASR